MQNLWCKCKASLSSMATRQYSATGAKKCPVVKTTKASSGPSVEARDGVSLVQMVNTTREDMARERRLNKFRFWEDDLDLDDYL